MLPYLPWFTHNPKDAKFLGSPIDFVVFDGLDAGRCEQVVFIEVKSGASVLTKREKLVRDAILEKRVVWKEINTGVIAKSLVEASEVPTEVAPAEPELVPCTCTICGAGGYIDPAYDGEKVICHSCGYEFVLAL